MRPRAADLDSVPVGVLFRPIIHYNETPFVYRVDFVLGYITPLVVEDNMREIKSQNVNSKITNQNSK